MILDDIAFAIRNSGKTTKWLCKAFNKERKTIFGYKNAMTFRLDYDFICGLNSIGLRLVLVDRKGNVVKDNILSAEELERLEDSHDE